MKNTTDRVQRALREFSEMTQLQENKEKERKELLKKVILRFDLNPLEEDFLRRHCHQEPKG